MLCGGFIEPFLPLCDKVSGHRIELLQTNHALGVLQLTFLLPTAPGIVWLQLDSGASLGCAALVSITQQHGFLGHLVEVLGIYVLLGLEYDLLVDALWVPLFITCQLPSIPG